MQTTENENLICGIIMPISAMPPEYDAAHWVDVRKVLNSAIDAAGLQPQIVSDSFESDVIQNRIVQNLYENAVVVCDVSGLNPNVMFELGIRITFNKPVIIITDNLDSIPFDTRIIEHLEYPRDLHIHKTNEFSKALSEKIQRINEKFLAGNYRTPMEALGNFEVFQPTTEVVSEERYIAERLDEFASTLSRLDRKVSRIGEGQSSQSEYQKISEWTLQEFIIDLKAETPDEFILGLDSIKFVSIQSWSNSNDKVRVHYKIEAPNHRRLREAQNALHAKIQPFVFQVS